MPAWHDIPFTTVPIDARLEGAPLEVYTGVQRYDPVQAVADMASDLAARGIGLEVGHYVSTGSATVPAAIAKGQTLVAIFGDLQLAPVDRDLVRADSQKPSELDHRGSGLAVRPDQQVRDTPTS